MSPVLAVSAAGLAALLAWPLTRTLGRAAGWPLALLYLAGAAMLVPAIGPALDGESTTARLPWVPARGWTVDLRVEPIGLLFAMLALVIGAVVLVYSTAYLRPRDDDGRRLPHYGFYQLMTVFTVSMLGLVLTDSAVALFVCWELTSLASFALIANAGRSAYPSAVRTLLVTFFGGLVLLSAIVAMSVRTGTTRLSEILASDVWHTDPTFTAVVGVLVAVAAMTKAAQWPFHFWLPDAMAAATPVSAYLHAAAVVKAGIFLLMRFSPAFAGTPAWTALLVTAGMGTAVMGAVFALQKTDLKQLMAYSTVSQLGWIVATIGIGTPAALAAAALHTLAHALFKSGLFMLVGVVDHEAGTRDLRRLGPLWRRMPWTFGATCLGAAAMAGIPPTLGFVSKESMLTAMEDVTPGHTWPAVLLLAVAVVGAALTVTYCARIVLAGFVFGPRDVSEVHEAPVRFWLPAALPAVAGLPLAFVVGTLDHPLTAIGRAATGADPHGDGFHEHASLWHGFTPALGLTALALTGGALLAWRRRRVGHLREGEPLLPFTGASATARGIDGLRRLARPLVQLTASDSPSRHAGTLLATVAAFALVTGVWGLADGIELPARAGTLDRPTDAILLVVITLGVVGLCVAPSRIAAVVLLSAVGIAVTVQLFALGAPDVGLTQLLVEALTVIVVMMVLRRLPGTFIRPSRRRRLASLAVAVACGLSATAAVWVFTGRRGRSGLGEYLLERGPEITTGKNVVNTILVEFRTLDTLGEVSVLGIAGIAILAVLGSLPADRLDPPDEASLVTPLWVRTPSPLAASALDDARRNTAPLRVVAGGVTPVLLAVAAVLLWRGHNAPGGGFIAALVASCAVAFVYLSRAADRPFTGPRVPVVLIGGGIALAGLTGIAGYALHTPGAFLEPAHWTIGHTHLSSALVFDIGVFSAVLGLVVTAVNVLGTGRLRAFVDGPGATEDADDLARQSHPTEVER